MAGSRSNYTGGHLLPIHKQAIISDLEAKAEELGIAEIDLMKKVGVTGTMLSMLRHTSQTHMFSQNVEKIATFLGVDKARYIRTRKPYTRHKKSVAKVVRAKRTVQQLNGLASHDSDDAVMITMDYYQTMRKQPVVEQAKAQRLLSLLMTMDK